MGKDGGVATCPTQFFTLNGSVQFSFFCTAAQGGAGKGKPPRKAAISAAAARRAAPQAIVARGLGNCRAFGVRRAHPEEAQQADMSNSDSFINEVTEELRRDRMFALMRRYGWIAILLILGVVGGAAWNEWQKAQRTASAQSFGDAIVAALEQGDSAATRDALGTIPATAEQTVILRLITAAEAEQSGETTAALATLAVIENDSAASDSYRQLAALKRVILAGGEMPAEERAQILGGLSQPGQAFRPLALEQLALLRLDQGESGAALAILRDLLDEPDVTSGLRQRVTQLIVALGGDAAAEG